MSAQFAQFERGHIFVHILYMGCQVHPFCIWFSVCDMAHSWPTNAMDLGVRSWHKKKTEWNFTHPLA